MNGWFVSGSNRKFEYSGDGGKVNTLGAAAFSDDPKFQPLVPTPAPEFAFPVLHKYELYIVKFVCLRLAIFIWQNTHTC